MTKFVSIETIVDDYASNHCEYDIASYTIENGKIRVVDTEGFEQIIDEDFICDMYGDACGGGAEMCLGGAMLFETNADRYIHDYVNSTFSADDFDNEPIEKRDVQK